MKSYFFAAVGITVLSCSLSAADRDKDNGRILTIGGSRYKYAKVEHSTNNSNEQESAASKKEVNDQGVQVNTLLNTHDLLKIKFNQLRQECHEENIALCAELTNSRNEITNLREEYRTFLNLMSQLYMTQTARSNCLEQHLSHLSNQLSHLLNQPRPYMPLGRTQSQHLPSTNFPTATMPPHGNQEKQQEPVYYLPNHMLAPSVQPTSVTPLRQYAHNHNLHIQTDNQDDEPTPLIDDSARTSTDDNDEGKNV